MFQALARDRLERLNASPSATPWTYFRVFSVLLFVLAVDCLWYNLENAFDNLFVSTLWLLFYLVEIRFLFLMIKTSM